MLARAWALGFVCSLVGISAGVTMACSSKPIQNSTSSPEVPPTEPESDSGSDAALPNWPDDDVTTETDAGTRSARPSCSLADVDDPDDDFADTNCDGIDGDKNKAIFVELNGSDSADGSWGKPVATLEHAIELAVATSKDVYACAGSYTENITVSAQAVRVYGGYDCSKNWARNSVSQARIAPPSGSALVITGTTQPVVFDHVDIASAAPATPGASSVAVFVANSTQVTLRRGTIQAADGATAQQPPAAAAAQLSPVVAKQGNSAAKTKSCGTLISPEPTCTRLLLSGFSLALPTSTTWNSAQTPLQFMYCPAGDYSYGGGGGGTDLANCYANNPGTPGYPLSTSGTLDGLDGKNGADVGRATTGVGTLDGSGYQPTNQGPGGNPGAAGQGGSGGRGGGVYLSSLPPDTSFGLEPLPLGGAAGNAGGASIAVGVYQSHVTIERATLQTGKGGNGSPGGEGGAGAPGIAGGALGTVNVCGTVHTTAIDGALSQAGGHGGKGGNGSRGGPGGGGPSIPLLVSGTEPTLSAVTFLPGSGGIGGSNGGPRAADGESMDQKVMP